MCYLKRKKREGGFLASWKEFENRFKDGWGTSFTGMDVDGE